MTKTSRSRARRSSDAGAEVMAREERARRIVETAVELAERGGFEAVRLRDVAANAGVALGTLYRHFRSKEDLLMAALWQEAEQLEAQLRKCPPQGEDATARVAAYFGAATRALCHKPKLARAVLRAAASGEPELTEKLQQFNGLLAGLCVAALRGQPYDGAQPTPQERVVAQTLQDVWFAALIGWMGGQHDQTAVIERVRIAADLVIRGAAGAVDPPRAARVQSSGSGAPGSRRT